MNKNFLVAASLEALGDLGEARQKWVSAALTLVGAERGLALANAVARQEITEAAGGAKALGSNADLRELALVKGLAFNFDYMTSLASHDEALEQEARAKQKMHTLSDTLKLFKVFLGADVFAGPVEKHEFFEGYPGVIGG